MHCYCDPVYHKEPYRGTYESFTHACVCRDYKAKINTTLIDPQIFKLQLGRKGRGPSLRYNLRKQGQ